MGSTGPIGAVASDFELVFHFVLQTPEFSGLAKPSRAQDVCRYNECKGLGGRSIPHAKAVGARSAEAVSYALRDSRPDAPASLFGKP